MDLIDAAREKKIFVPRIRHEWLDALVKRYIQMNGEIGTSLLPNEQKRASIYNDIFYFKYEQMIKLFLLNKKNFKDFENFKSLEEFIEGILKGRY